MIYGIVKGTRDPLPTRVARQVSNIAFAAVTLSALYQVAADDGLCNSPYNLQRHPMRVQAYEGV